MLIASAALCNPTWVYSPNMGFRELTDSRFGRRVREQRERREWSQEELAKRLTDMGIQVYPSTIAKIESEKKPRAARLGEAVGIADLFDLSLDELLGREWPDDSTLNFGLGVLRDCAGDAERAIDQAQGFAADIEDIAKSLKESFRGPDIDGLLQAAQDMADHLLAARSNASTLVSIAGGAIAEATKEAPESGPGQRRD